jgi:carbonic anhydrase/acetyltransferase-like protein (isoleucine patch superfamily)
VEGSLSAIAADAYVAPGAVLVGDVRMAAESSVFHNAVLRGQAAYVALGERANVQDNCVVEGTPGHPAVIGARVSVGHNAHISGATVEDGALIAIGATLLPGAHVGAHAIVAANATVPSNMHVPPRSLVIGHGRILREVTEAEIERIERGAREYARLNAEYRSAPPRRPADASPDVPRPSSLAGDGPASH